MRKAILDPLAPVLTGKNLERSFAHGEVYHCRLTAQGDDRNHRGFIIRTACQPLGGDKELILTTY